MEIDPWMYIVVAAAVFGGVLVAAWRAVSASRRAEERAFDEAAGVVPEEPEGPAEIGTELRAMRMLLERLDARVASLERSLKAEERV
jgi:hypothetical protein